MDTKKFFESATFKRALITIGALLAVLIIFQTGVFVGFHEAAFSFRMGDNYYRAFGTHGSLPPGFAGDVSSAHGAAGKIVSVSLPTFIIEDPNGTEKTVLVGTTTAIRQMRESATPTDIMPGEFAIVLGSPDAQARIEATFIRLMPPPPTATTSNINGTH